MTKKKIKSQGKQKGKNLEQEERKILNMMISLNLIQIQTNMNKKDNLFKLLKDYQNKEVD
jgi:hypothetical protein